MPKIVRTKAIAACRGNRVSPRSRKQLVTALLLAVLLSAGFAQKPTEKPPDASPDFSKEAYTIERLATRITAEGDGTGSREVSAEVKILADAGVKAFAVLNFTYTSANETVEIDYVRVRKPDGTIVKTPDYNIQDMAADVTRTAPIYSDIHEKHVAVKGLAVGDVLAYLVRYRIVKPEVPGQFWHEYSFVKDAIAKDELLEISLPSGKYLKVVSPQFKPEVKEEGARRVYRWKYSNLTVKETDPNEAPRRFPHNPDVQVTTFASWEDVGNWYRALQKDSLQVTPAIRAKAAGLTKGLTTDEDKIRALYYFVSLKYHYIGLDFGIGRYQPHAADDVLDNGYGDCKDKHTLLAALLQAVGIEAWPVLIHGRRKLEVDVPSPAQFDHVITVVPRGDRLIWLDTTPEVSPYGLILLSLRNKQALVIPSGKPPVLMTTPENPTFPQEQKFSMAGKLAADGTFSGHAEQSYRGDSEVSLREVFREVAQSQWKEVVQRLSYRMNFGGDVSNVNITPPDDLDRPFELSYDYVRKNYGDWENRQVIQPLPPMGMEVAKDSKDQKPLDPVLLGAVGKITYHSRVELPLGYVAIAPAKVHLEESFAEYKADTQIESGIMTTTRDLVVKKSEVPLGEWDGFRKFGRAMFDDEFSFIKLNRTYSFENKAGGSAEKDQADENDVDRLVDLGTDALRRRDSRRAQDLFEKVIAKDPQHRAAHLNLGIALMAQNRAADALSEFLKEEEISPNDPQSFQMAAFVANLTGNRDEAIVELRKLLKVDPENSTGAASLGGLLSGQGKYSEAVEVLEGAVKAAPDSPSLQYQLGLAYLKTNQKDKGVSHLQKAAEQNDADPMVLNNIAYELADSKTSLDLARPYAEKALMALEENSLHESDTTDTRLRVTYELSLLWDTLGWVYFQSGDTDRAESFVRSAWLLGLEPVVGEHLGEIYEKQGKTKMAAKAYELAFAANETPPLAVRRGLASASLTETNAREALNKELTGRYKKLTGKTPGIRESWRLPNGAWTKTASEQLRLLRTISFGKRPGLSGSAEFIVVFAPGEIESVKQVTGDKALNILMEKLDAGSFHVEFPAGSHAKILRRAQVGCFPLSGCIAVLMPVSAVSAQGSGPN